MKYAHSLLAVLWLVLQIAVRDGVDVIHAANPPDYFVLIALVLKPFGVRFIYDQHDLAPEMYRARAAGKISPFTEKVLRTLERWSYRFANHVIVTNASYRENAMHRGKVPASRISIVRNGPTPAQLQHGAEPIPGISQPGVTTFAYLGQMGVQDGVVHLVQALNHLRRDLGRTDFRCFFIGSGEEQQRLEQLARIMGVGQHVCFTGFIPEPEYVPYILAADICIDPDPSSEYNNRSTMVKVMDYMTFAKPIVAFDLPETRRSAEGAALYVTPNDELEFAKALERLMDNPEERASMGALGRRRVEAELSWSSSVESLLRAYAALPLPRKHAAPLAAPSGAAQSKS
jgi:glycosyltransferase involved in cell wall biosynthesis